MITEDTAWSISFGTQRPKVQILSSRPEKAGTYEIIRKCLFVFILQIYPTNIGSNSKKPNIQGKYCGEALRP
jgi:hypothetical protein